MNPPPILVTAFGPFGGRKVNASSMALALLRRSLAGIRTRTLPVDLVEGPRRLHDAVRRTRPAAILLLGEAAGAVRMRLEERAWNELDFTLPDNAGRQPRRQVIEDSGPLFLETTFDVGRLHEQLAERGHEVERSTDPGRYLCNRIYHAALQRHSVPTIFVHLPLETRLEPVRAVVALEEIVSTLRNSTAPSPGRRDRVHGRVTR